MRKWIQLIVVFFMTFSLAACGSKEDKEKDQKDEKTSEKTEEKKDTKKETKEPEKKEIKKQETQEDEEDTYYDEEEEYVIPVYEEIPVDEKDTEDYSSYIYVPEEDLVFNSYEEALAYGNDNMNAIHDKYGKHVFYSTSKNESGQIVLSWYISQ